MRGLPPTATRPVASDVFARGGLLALILLLHLALLLRLQAAPARSAHAAPVALLKVQLLGASPGSRLAPALPPARPRPSRAAPKALRPAAPVQAPTARQALPAVPLLPAASTQDAQPDLAPPLDYLMRIARLVSRSQRYPWSARQYGQQGDVLVRVHLHRDGRVLTVTLLQSSGVAALDAEACAVMLRIARFPPFPADYLPQVHEFDLDQPVNFRHYQL